VVLTLGPTIRLLCAPLPEQQITAAVPDSIAHPVLLCHLLLPPTEHLWTLQSAVVQRDGTAWRKPAPGTTHPRLRTLRPGLFLPLVRTNCTVVLRLGAHRFPSSKRLRLSALRPGSTLHETADRGSSPVHRPGVATGAISCHPWDQAPMTTGHLWC
jgi:hypothetical protein